MGYSSWGRKESDMTEHTHTHPGGLQFLGSQGGRHDCTRMHTHEVEKSKIQAPANLARREGLLSSLHLATTSPWVHVTCSLHTHSTQVPVPLLVRISNLITGTRLS